MITISIGLPLLFLYLASVVVLVQFKGDTSIANFTWGGGVMLATVYTFFTMSLWQLRQILITLLMVLWAMRLIIYVYMRYDGKDPRYRTWHWSGWKALLINCCWVFGQSIMIAVMSYPALMINTSSLPGLTYLDLAGFIIWCFGFCYESISDYQLYHFMHQPHLQDSIMCTGLWRYSRHPNYFGEITMWWGVYCIALSVPYGWTSIIAPLAITSLLVCVTGVPWVEKAFEHNKEYVEYKKRTSMLIPWFPHP